ncbi:MAG TPA: hypothetical protein VFT04_04505 [Gemmatimonadales bacterium]|nr:hypothetical protein [Gemmatimonadales bacterium]
MIDDPVSRSIVAEARTTLVNHLSDARLARRPLDLPERYGVEASMVELEPIGGIRRVRVEIVHM